MKNLFAILTLCVASVAMAAVPVDVVLDITDPDNVTITQNVADGTYGGQYLAIDALEFFGATADLTLTGPFAFTYPKEAPAFDMPITTASGGQHTAFTSGTFWMEYGVTYKLGEIVTSSNPADFYADDSGTTYVGKFIVTDTTFQNGLSTTDAKLLGTIVPEPASMSMLALGALALIRRRR